jgi:outer membrane protein OmpA-like peptidoglycan-associated protein/tetratricopeptide (TPR) repeat protein
MESLKNKLVTLTLLLIPFMGSSQYTEIEVKNIIAQASEQELVIENSRLLQENFFHFADLITDKLLEINPKSSNYKYRKGFIELEMRHNYKKAIELLLSSTGNIDRNYDMYSIKEGSVPADIFYHLGRAYHLDEDFDKALENFNTFLEQTHKNSELIAETENRIKQCGVAKKLMANAKDVEVVNLGDSINTEYADFSSNISLDGRALYFTSRRPWAKGESDGFKDPMLNHFPEDIYQAELSTSNEWQNTKKMSMCKPNFNEASVSVSIDERRVYTYNDKSGLGDIYYSDYMNGRFSTIVPVKINDVNNAERWETHYTVSPDGNTVFFVSDRLEGYGKRDIYMMEKIDGEWSEPKNMGGNINSEWDEDAPFMGLDNNVLYFSSTDSSSMGEFDIFMSVKDENKIWSNPVNLGYPINSVGDDLFYTHTADGKKAYLTSFRKGGKGEKDVYRIDVTSNIQNIAFLNGEIIHAQGKDIPEDSYVQITCLDCEDSESMLLTPRVRDGVFLSKLDKCKEYELAYYYNENTKDPYTETFSTNCDLAYEEIYKRVLLDDEAEIIIPFFDYKLEGIVADRESGEVIGDAQIQLYDLASSDSLEAVTSDSMGYFISALLDGKSFGFKMNYGVKVNALGYLNGNFKAEASLGVDSVIRLTYLLDKKEIGMDLGPFMIYYNFDKYDIREDAKTELDKIVKIMTDNPEIKIELGSHTDCRGSSSYNMRLSKKRAKSAANYISSRITSPSRITSKGYGESKLVNDCNCSSECSKEDHQINRRTEFIIVP